MSKRKIVLRETLVSIVINIAISVGFFFLVFGLAKPIDGSEFGRDLWPQSFMVALMGTMIPSLLIRRGTAAPVEQVIQRSVMLAVASLVIAGGAAWLIFSNVDTVQPLLALVIKFLFAALLSAVVTPIAVIRTLASAGSNS